MRQDDWELQITVDGQPLEEYNVDGRSVVAAQPGKKFEVKITYFGDATDPFVVEILIDGKKTGNRIAVRPTGTSGNSLASRTVKGWMKSEGGHSACSSFTFVGTPVNEEGEESCTFGVGQTNWLLGVVELQVQKAAIEVARYDVPWPSVRCDTTAASGLSERELVKGGLSSSVGRGETAFDRHSSKIMIRAGQAMVVALQGEAVHSYRLYYRDDFFLALSGHVDFDDADEVKILPKSTGKATARRLKDLRSSMKRIQQTKTNLKKRHKSSGPVTIDLTSNDVD